MHAKSGQCVELRVLVVVVLLVEVPVDVQEVVVLVSEVLMEELLDELELLEEVELKLVLPLGRPACEPNGGRSSRRIPKKWTVPGEKKREKREQEQQHAKTTANNKRRYNTKHHHR